MPNAEEWVLRFTKPWKEIHWFCNLGGNWKNSNNRLIERTTTRADEARAFETAEAAREILVSAGSPAGWEVVPRP